MADPAGEYLLVVEEHCYEGDCEDAPADGEWCSHARLVPTAEAEALGVVLIGREVQADG